MELKHFIHIYYSCYSNSSSAYTFATEEITGCTNEVAKGASKVPRSPPSFFTSSVTIHLNLLMIL